jgi:hypothetical protein
MAQLSKGQTFAVNDTVTNTKLHTLVDNGTLASGAITEQALQTAALTTSDVVLFSDVSAGNIAKLELSKLFAEPGPIGTTTPQPGAFTTLTASTATLTSATLTSASIGTLTGAAPSIAKAWVSFDGGISLATNPQTTSSATFIGATITANFAVAHGLNTGDSIYITGQTGNNTPLNGTWSVTVTSGTQFTFVVGSTPAGTLSNFSVTKVPIKAAYNVSSVARIATGSYRINFTTPFSDANYAIGMSFAAGGSAAYNFVAGIGNASQTTTSCDILVERSDGADTNWAFISMIFFR